MTGDTTDSYAAIARWYDIEHDAFTDDIACYSSLLPPGAGAGLHVLEIGAGTGRIAVALAAAGHRVTAVEPSAAMRARAAARLTQLPERVARRVRMVAGSATELRLAPEERFDAALFGLNTLPHLTTLAERLLALRSVHTHLTSGAQLLLDLDLLGPRRLGESVGQLWWQGTWRLPDGDGEVSHIVTGTAGREPGTVEIVHFYDVTDAECIMRRTVSRMPLALLSRGEVELTLLHAGYSVEAAYGSYDLAPADETSPRLILVASA
jgi:SAM-dependent methyltransferase